MFVGFLMTFLIQHVIGLDGMPRRVYEYDNVGHLALYNLISTVGSFILAAGVLRDDHQRRRAASSTARSPGPTRGRRNTLEWFTTSPPPANNFDVVPLRALARADEGHPPDEVGRDAAPGTATCGRARGECLPARRQRTVGSRSHEPVRASPVAVARPRSRTPRHCRSPLRSTRSQHAPARSATTSS